MTKKNKRGSKKKLQSPEQLFQLFEEYVQSVKSNPKEIRQWVGKDGKEVMQEKERPLTMVGFETYLAEKGVIRDLKDYMSATRKGYTAYKDIARRIKRKIEADQLEGGLMGIYNSSITARINGYTDKTQSEIKATGTLDVKTRITGMEIK